ncbi:MAG: DJ-1/PfpI family protein [Ruminococcaceae bacterium]|nr:DJ-1/PfpI family protein [Oscillospiraceae bacterium]
MIYMFLAEGFEEVEALAPLDVMRRAGLDVATVGVGDNFIRGSHGVTVVCDLSTTGLEVPEFFDGVILPGGMPGTVNLEKNRTVQAFIDAAYERHEYLCAICAAPSILGHKGYLSGKNAVCFPGYEEELEGAVISDKGVVRDGKFITAKGMGVATEFGLEIVAAFLGQEKADSVKSKIQMV